MLECVWVLVFCVGGCGYVGCGFGMCFNLGVCILCVCVCLLGMLYFNVDIDVFFACGFKDGCVWIAFICSLVSVQAFAFAVMSK